MQITIRTYIYTTYLYIDITLLIIHERVSKFAQKHTTGFAAIVTHQVRIPGTLLSKHTHTRTLQSGMSNQDLICDFRSVYEISSLKSQQKNRSCDSIIILCPLG